MIVKVQANIVGFSPNPCSLFSAFDTATGVLAISVEAKGYMRTRHGDSALVTDDPNLDRDHWFSMTDIDAAIRAFYSFRNGITENGSKQLLFDPKVSRAEPNSSIERDGFDTSGPRYRIADTITNLHVATLATCLYANQSRTIHSTLDMADGLARDIARLESGEILTI